LRQRGLLQAVISPVRPATSLTSSGNKIRTHFPFQPDEEGHAQSKAVDHNLHHQRFGRGYGDNKEGTTLNDKLYELIPPVLIKRFQFFTKTVNICCDPIPTASKNSELSGKCTSVDRIAFPLR
jgi:hypothetical protein